MGGLDGQPLGQNLDVGSSQEVEFPGEDMLCVLGGVERGVGLSV